MSHTPDPLSGWQEEMRSAWLYRQMAAASSGREAELFASLATSAERQAGIWQHTLLAQDHAAVPVFRPDLRSRLVAWLLRWFGVRAMRPVLSALKIRGMSVFGLPPAHPPLPADAADIGRRHHPGGQANLRAMVFGVNDGLVSNTSLILGMAGATADSISTVLLAGLAGLLAGAFSMAAGEYVSVRSQREMYQYQIGLEREELRLYPQEEAEELALIYHARGMDAAEARHVAHTLVSHPERALETLAREELGLNPDDLGSPLAAALSSFLAFCLGAGIPLLALLFFGGGSLALRVAPVSACALFVIGATLSLFTGRGALRGGLRMLLIGGGAGYASFVIGAVIHIRLN
ncbi:MAG: VIT1/CCC1 transporter family protein [Betaproteobacteria bacterium]|nr:VIT1/CCC1 transporter family protein [Betaproteobacteria bacterium]